MRQLPDPDPGVVTSPAHVIYLPDAADLKPRADLPGFHGTQLYHLVMVGEKSSLRDDLVALAERFQADWYLPDGEISDTHIWLMAKPAVADGRMLVLLYFADCDPAGHQMILSVTRKLQAFQRFPGLESLQFVAYRVLLTPDQVRAYGLPSSPLNSGEKRGPAWKAAYGVEQTEVDALMDADPDAIQNIAGELIEGRFFDTTLAARVEAVRDRWLTQAQEIVDEQDSQVQARADVVARLEQIEQEATAEVEALVTAVAPTDIDPDGLPWFRRSPSLRLTRTTSRSRCAIRAGASPYRPGGSSRPRTTRSEHEHQPRGQQGIAETAAGHRAGRGGGGLLPPSLEGVPRRRADRHHLG